MECKEIAEKLFTRKSNMDEEQIVKEVMTNYTPDKIQKLLASGKTDEEVNQLIKDTIASVLRKRQKDYMNELQHDNPHVRNMVGKILGIMNLNYKTGKTGITAYQLRNILRKSGQVVDMYRGIAHEGWVKIFNGVMDGETPADPSKFYRDPKRAANLKSFLLTGKTVGSSVEMQLQLRIDEYIKDLAKQMRIDPQSIKDIALMNKSSLYMQYKRETGGIPRIRGKILGERRYAYIVSTEDSMKFQEWFNSKFEDIVPNAKDRQKLFDEMIGYSKSLLNDFDPKDTTTLGGFNKFESLRRAEILNDKIVQRWAEISGIDGEEVLELMSQKSSNAYGVLNSFGDKPLRNADSIKNIAMTAASGVKDGYSQDVINKMFKDYEGVLKYVMGERSNVEPSLLMDAVDIAIGVTRMFKSPLMALRQMDDYTVRNFFMKKFENKSRMSTMSDTLKYTKRAAFGDDYDKLSKKDKEIILGVGTSLADDLFGHGESLTRAYQKDAGWLARGGDFSYTYLSGMAYHERVFERAGMLHTSSVIKGLQNQSYSSIMKLDPEGRTTRGSMRRALLETGITEREWELFRKIGFSSEYFSSDELLDFLKNNREEVRKLLDLGDDNMDFYSINKSIEILTNSQIPFKYDVETGFFSPESKEALIQGALDFYKKRTNVNEDMLGDLRFALDALEGIQYLNNDLVFYWKPETYGLSIIQDSVEKNLRNQFNDARAEYVSKYRIGEYNKILKNNKERKKIIDSYNKYLSEKGTERFINREIDKKTEDIYAKFQDLRNNMFQESSVLRFDYWDKYMADRAAGDTRNAAINKMFSFYKSALWKNTERMANVFRDYDANGVLGVKSFFNRYSMADYASYTASAGVFGTLNLLLSGDILSEDKRSEPANIFMSSLFVGSGLYLTAPIKLVDGLFDMASGAATLDDRKFMAGFRQARNQVIPSTVSNYAEALMENYF